MLIAFVIVLMVVGLAVLGSLYSLFLPFFEQLGDIKQYNMAYYGAVSGVERGMLSLRYHGPGFEGKSGWENGTSMGHSADAATGDLGALADGSLYRSTQSRTTTIPAAGQGNVPYALLPTGASNDHMILSADDLMVYHLDLDQTTDVDEYYSDGFSSARSSGLDALSLYAQLPKKLHTLYDDDLANTCAPTVPGGCDRDGDNIDNDLVIDRSMEGVYDDDSFRIVPRVDVNYVSGTVNLADSLIRESHINDTTNNSGSRTAEWSSIVDPTEESVPGSSPLHNIIGPSSVLSALGNEKFEDIYNESNIDDVQLLLGLARRLLLPDGRLYPFLETRLVSDEPISDLYYHLDGVGAVGDYSVTIQVKKPTSDRSLFGSFTIVF